MTKGMFASKAPRPVRLLPLSGAPTHSLSLALGDAHASQEKAGAPALQFHLLLLQMYLVPWPCLHSALCAAHYTPIERAPTSTCAPVEQPAAKCYLCKGDAHSVTGCHSTAVLFSRPAAVQPLVMLAGEPFPPAPGKNVAMAYPRRCIARSRPPPGGASLSARACIVAFFLLDCC